LKTGFSTPDLLVGQKTDGGAENQKGGAHFYNTALDVCSNRWAKREMGWGTDFKWGGRALLGPPLATALAGPLIGLLFRMTQLISRNNAQNVMKGRRQW